MKYFDVIFQVLKCENLRGWIQVPTRLKNSSESNKRKTKLIIKLRWMSSSNLNKLLIDLS